MPAQTETAWFCGQYFSLWTVPSSRGDDAYSVTLAGAEGPVHCTCPAWKFAPEDGKDCKHIRRVWEHGCLANPQWKDPGPNDFAAHGIALKAIEATDGSPPCPGCGGPQVAVKIAV